MSRDAGTTEFFAGTKIIRYRTYYEREIFKSQQAEAK